MPEPTTFAAFTEEWLREHAERNCSPKTVERYRQFTAYILPHIGTTKLQDLSVLTLERIFNRLKDDGGWNRATKSPRPLSPKTVRHIAGLVHVILETAIRWKLLKFNPLTGVRLPKISKRESKALDTTQLALLFDAAHSGGVYEFVMLAAATGCRRGELLALTWSDVDFIGRVLKVSKSVEQTKQGLRVKSTKNEKPRSISLPPSTIDMLTGYRLRQSESGRIFGADYRNDLDLVFGTPAGDYLKPDSLTAVRRQLLFPINDNYSSRSATTTTFVRA